MPRPGAAARGPCCGRECAACAAQRRTFRDWDLPAALERVQRRLAGSDDGDRQMSPSCRRVDQWIAGSGSCLRAGDSRGRALLRRDHQHSHPAARPGTVRRHSHAGGADAAAPAGRGLRQVRPTRADAIERTEVLDMTGASALRDEGGYQGRWLPRSTAKHEPQRFVGACSRPRSPRNRPDRSTALLDRLTHHCES